MTNRIVQGFQFLLYVIILVKAIFFVQVFLGALWKKEMGKAQKNLYISFIRCYNACYEAGGSESVENRIGRLIIRFK